MALIDEDGWLVCGRCGDPAEDVVVAVWESVVVVCARCLQGVSASSRRAVSSSRR